MRKSTKFFVCTLIILFSQLSLIAQSDKNEDYAAKKMEFWKEYQSFKNNFTIGIDVFKPVDPNGLFAIDENNNFIVKTDGINNQNSLIPSWIFNEQDVVSGYVWAQSTSTYTSISGSGTLVGSNLDEESYGSLNIGFTFTYDGVAYTQFGLNANGFISMGATAPVSSYNSISSGSTNNVIALMNRDLYGLATGNGIYYQTTGTAPNRVLVVEWKNWGNYSSGLNEYNFQIQIFETTNKIAYVFGPCTPSTTTTMECGFRTVIGDYSGRAVPASTSWSSSSPGYICNISSTYYPSNGLTWTWNPPPTGVMGYYSGTTIQIQPGVPYQQGLLNAQIIKVAIADTGISNPISITQFKFATTGSNNPSADILNAKLYYTGSTNTFSTTTQYGSTVSSPNGVFYITGSQALVANATNYFWLTYDISGSAITGDSVDAQCDSITGTNAMGTVAPIPTAPFGSNPIDPYCLGTVTNAGCPYGLYITNVLFGSINNTTGCNDVMPYCYNNYTNLSTTVRQNNPYLITVTNMNIGNPNPTAFGIWIDWNNNSSFADGGEYFPTTIIPANVTTTATATISVPAGATLGNHRMRIRTNLSSPPASGLFCSNLSYGEQEDYTVRVIADTNMTYSSSTTTQTNTSNIYAPLNDAQIIGIEVNVFGNINPVNATNFSLSTLGSTNPSTDISKAKIWYTGASAVFATTTLFGTTISPNGTFAVTGSQPLQSGTNYFWLTYDVPSTAVLNDTLDARCNSITVGGIARIPSIISPAGFRIISGTSMSGNYTIPGSYPNFTSAIADLNSRGTSGPVIFNVSSGFVDTAVNLTINVSGSATSPIIFQRVGTNPLPNPLIVAGVGISTTTDGIIKINGGDYIVFDGIDLQENPANVTTTTQTEWGYALVKPDGTNGCQNVIIKNCNITLIKTNANSVGIYSGNHIPTSTTSLTVTAVSGTASNNTFLNNTITNSYSGISINGFNSAAPYTFYDQNNSVSGCSMSNYGGTATTAYGIYNIYQNNLTINGCTINSTGGINSTGTLYGIFCSTMVNSNLTISNNTVTIVGAGTTSTIYGIGFGNGSAGTSNNINILNNTVQNCSYPSATSASMILINCNATANNLTVSGNRTIGNTYGGAASTGTAVYAIYNANSALNSITITNNLDSGNVNSGTTSISLYRIYNSATTFSTVITGNQVKNNVVSGTTSTSTGYGIFNSSGTFSCNISNNIVANITLLTTSSSTYYGMYNSSAAPAFDMNNNTVTDLTGPGTGTFYGIYYTASPGVNSTVNINNNSVTNLSKTAAGTGSLYGIYQGSTPQGTLNMNNNIITGFSSAAATVLAGIYQASSPPNYININNNRIGNFTNGGASVIYGIYSTATTSSQITMSGDSVFNFSSPGGTIYGLFLTSSGLNWNVFKNSVTGLNSHTSTAGLAHGIWDAVTLAGSTVNIYNNFISDINTPASTSIAPALSGININTGTATKNVNIFYNTIYLNAASTGTSFSTAGIFASTTPIVNLRNNVIINKSTPGSSSGQTVAYRRSSTTLTTYGSVSNNNCFFSGTPAANRLIYFDGTNSEQTLAAYKTRVVPRDNNSITEDPPFVNAVTPPFDLRILASVATGLESGGQVISAPVNITDDKFFTARFPNTGFPVGGYTPIAPDIGAHEFGGLNADLTPPQITYTPLGNGGTSDRAFTNVVITDNSGVNTIAGTRPRCYYKRSTDANTIVDNLNTSNGWKFVESNGTSSPFDFTINYSLLFGGTGVTAGNVVNYFVIAQDLAVTPNVGSNQATFSITPSSVNLAAGTVVLNNLSYTIVSNVFSGSYNVGTAQTYTSLTGAGGLFAAINAGTVSGNITALITSDMVEDGTNQLNLFNEVGAGGYTLTIAPSSASMKTISGSVANGMIRLSGARRVTINGNGGFAPPNSKYLTFRNTNISNPTFTFINDAVRDTIKHCIIESNNTSTATTSAGAVLFSTTTGTQGNDSNVIMNCDIRDRTDTTGTPAFGIYNNGTTTTPMQYNSFNVISNCNIFNYFFDGGVFTGGIYLNSGTTDWTITGNSFYQTTTRTVVNGSTFASIYNNISTLTNNNQITNNFIGGSAPLCGGTPMTFTGTGAYSVMGIQAFVSVQAPTNITGNTIRNIDLTYNSATLNAGFFRPIYAQTGWVNVNNNTVGSGTGTGSILLTINTTATAASIGLIHHLGLGTINNNTIGSVTYAGNSTAANTLYAGIFWANSSPAGLTFTVDNNLVGSLTTANSIQLTNNSDLHQFRAIYFTNSTGSTNNITNNTVANITSMSTSAVNGCFIYGINNNGGAGLYNFTNNTVRNLTINNDVLTSGFLILGLNSTGAGTNTFVQNTVYSLYSNGTGAGANLIGGILAGGTTGGTVSRNKIYDLRSKGSGVLAPAPLMLGLNVQSSGIYTISNNMISLTNDDPVEKSLDLGSTENKKVEVQETLPFKTPLNPKDYDGISTDWKFNTEIKPDPCDGLTPDDIPISISSKETQNNNNQTSTFNSSLAGVYHTSTSFGACRYLYNTFYIGGTQPGGLNSWTFYRSSTGTLSFRNNLFINARSGGSGTYYVFANESASPSLGWPDSASNYNAYLGSNASTIGAWGLGNNQSFAQWLTSSGCDKQSWSTTTSIINPFNLVNNISTGDLTIRTATYEAWLVSGKGIALSGMNTDYTGNTRATTIAGGCTDIGAHEFTATPPSNPVATQVGTPVSGGTSDYFLFGRKICTVDWGIGGTSYPGSLNINYYSGINPPNAGSLTANYSNSYWTVVPGSGSLTGAEYDITFYMGDNETYSISSPSSNTALAKYDVFWQTYKYGSGLLQSDLNWSNTTLKVRGLNRFSTFTLTDGAYACGPISPSHKSSGQPLSLNLVWSGFTGATSYKVQVATDSTFASGLIVNDSTVTDTTRTLSGLVNNTNYFWRVRGKTSSVIGSNSAVFKFKTTPAAPSAPLLVSPTNGAVNQPLTLNLVWRASAGATTYRVQLSTNSGFTSFVINDSTVTDTLKAVSGLSQTTTYYWRVTAKNTGGTSPFSSTWSFTTQALFPSLTIKVYLEGFYSPEPTDNEQTKNGRGGDYILAQVPDTIKIYLADSTQNYAFKDSVKVFLPSTGTITTPFTNASTGKYYIVVRHRNHLETWSKYAVSFTGGSTTSYDFTTAASQAYGDNMKQVGSVYVIYGGDPNQDGDIGALDIPIFISQFGTQGYLSCDFNGDNDVTGIDQQILIQNFGITVARPPMSLLIIKPENGKGLKEYQDKLREFQGKQNDVKNNR